MKSRAYSISGMCCAEEVALLRKAVGPLVGGEKNLSFDVLRRRMVLFAIDDDFDESRLFDAVKRTGMAARPWHDAPSRNEQARRGLNAQEVCIIGGTALVAAMTVHAIQCGFWGAFHCTEPIPPLSNALYFATIILGLGFILPKALLAVRRLRPDMNSLMFIAIGGAVAIGELREAATVAFLYALALMLESWSVGRARRAIEELMDITPEVARYICPHDGDILERPVSEVPVGVTVIVRPGERIPLDGIVTKGATTVDQSPITGESMPVNKELDDEVFAGSINGEGAFEFRATKEADETTLARIIKRVEEAEVHRAPAEQWIERFARHYTPAMLMLALAIALMSPLLLGLSWRDSFYQALVILVIACPCALVISTPVTIVSSLASAARSGVLIKGGAYLEAPARIRAVALDKTGTLTKGCPEVQKIIPLSDHSEMELLARAAGLEAHSEHPIAQAILRRAQTLNVTPLKAESFRAIRGKGAEAQIDGRRFWMGSHRLIHELGMDTPECHRAAESLEDAGHSVVAVGNDVHVCGLISVADGLRDEAAEAVKALRCAGVEHIVMLTGDNTGTATAVAREADLDAVLSELLPEDKENAIHNLTERYGQVMMMGDGINDAPAMAAAGVSVAMGLKGTDVAIETADIALMADDLQRLPWLIKHSRRALGIIRQNVVFALGTKLFFIVLTLMGHGTLWMAIAADMGASLLVIFNGLRMLRPSK